MHQNIAVLLSGNGSNLKAIIDKGIKVSFVVSNNSKALGLKIAKNANIPSYTWDNVSELEKEVLKLINEYNVKLLVLAGFMKLLSRNFVTTLPSKFIVNIHPSLLPKYKGMNAIKQALEDCAEYTGVTIHYVDEGIDSGSIIKQYTIKINKNDNLELLKERLQLIEHRFYPDTINSILSMK
tara:strand:+ start:9 stop:551 length:543 start_codon:yes stop_codon:yes gene_type:complete